MASYKTTKYTKRITITNASKDLAMIFHPPGPVVVEPGQSIDALVEMNCQMVNSKMLPLKEEDDATYKQTS